MATVEIKKSDIPLWSGANGSLVLNIDGDPSQPVSVGADPIVEAGFKVDGNQDFSFARAGAAAIGIAASAHARIVPIFQENVGGGADLVRRFSLTDSLKPDNLLLAFEIGGDANLTAPGAFHYSVLSANATLKAGADATYVAVRSFPRTMALEPMLRDLIGNLTLPAGTTRPPARADVFSFEFGGQLNFTVGASAGYELRGTNSFKVSEILLSEHCALSVIGKLFLTGQVAGRFSVDVTAGTEPGFARVVVRRRREKELQFAADVNVEAGLTTDGLPASGKEFLGALLGLEGKNWLNLADGLVTEAGQADSIDNLKAKLDRLAMDYLGAFAGKAIDKLTAVPEFKAFQERLAKVVSSYRTLDQRAIALFDRYFDPAVNLVGELEAKLEELNALESFGELKGEVDPVLWNALRQLTDGDPLGWILGQIPGKPVPSLPELKRRIDNALSLIRDEAHEEIRRFLGIAKEQFKLDRLFAELARISSPEDLKAAANEKLGHFAERLIGAGVDKMNGEALRKAFGIVQDVVKGRDKFFAAFDTILKEAAAQSFTMDLHAAYASATESQALIDVEIKIEEADGSPNGTGLRFMQAAGRGDFQEILANYQPAAVKLREGLLTHKATRKTSVMFNVAGWHRSFRYEAMHRVIVETQQQIRDSGNGVLTVFTNVDMTADSEKRRRGSKSEEAVLANFLLRFLAESRISGAGFDRKNEQYLLDVITGMSASYGVTFMDTNTSEAELGDYLRFARELGLDKVGATREALAPVLEVRNGSYGRVESDYEVRYTEAGVRRLMRAARISDEDVRNILRRIVLGNYSGHPTLRDAGWLYCSDEVRALFDEHGNNFVNAETILGGAAVGRQFSNTYFIRNLVAVLFRIEDRTLRAFGELRTLLASEGKIKTSELEDRLKSFGDVLNSFDGFDMGENSVFAVFDGLILLATAAAEARSSSLTFKSWKDGAERTKVFTLRAAEAARAAGRG